jgi:hypothetical protein
MLIRNHLSQDKGREVCACQTHVNIRMCVQALAKVKDKFAMLPTSKLPGVFCVHEFQNSAMCDAVAGTEFRPRGCTESTCAMCGIGSLDFSLRDSALVSP